MVWHRVRVSETQWPIPTQKYTEYPPTPRIKVYSNLKEVKLKKTCNPGIHIFVRIFEFLDASGFLDDSEDQVYDGIRDPYVLVINNANFYNSPGSRSGTFYDRGYVRRFVKEAGFRSVTEHFDLRKNEMLDVLELTRHKRALGEWTCSDFYLLQVWQKG